MLVATGDTTGGTGTVGGTPVVFSVVVVGVPVGAAPVAVTGDSGVMIMGETGMGVPIGVDVGAGVGPIGCHCSMIDGLALMTVFKSLRVGASTYPLTFNLCAAWKRLSECCVTLPKKSDIVTSAGKNPRYLRVS